MRSKQFKEIRLSFLQANNWDGRRAKFRWKTVPDSSTSDRKVTRAEHSPRSQNNKTNTVSRPKMSTCHDFDRRTVVGQLIKALADDRCQLVSNSDSLTDRNPAKFTQHRRDAIELAGSCHNTRCCIVNCLQLLWQAVVGAS